MCGSALDAAESDISDLEQLNDFTLEGVAGEWADESGGKLWGFDDHPDDDLDSDDGVPREDQVKGRERQEGVQERARGNAEQEEQEEQEGQEEQELEG